MCVPPFASLAVFLFSILNFKASALDNRNLGPTGFYPSVGWPRLGVAVGVIECGVLSAVRLAGIQHQLATTVADHSAWTLFCVNLV